MKTGIARERPLRGIPHVFDVMDYECWLLPCSCAAASTLQLYALGDLQLHVRLQDGDANIENAYLRHVTRLPGAEIYWHIVAQHENLDISPICTTQQ
jgi:hypothetical protein